MAARPGVMIYFDQWEPLLKSGDETVGALLRAVVLYAKYGEVPEFSGLPDILWGMLRPVIDKDGERYEQATTQKQYAVYCREIKKQGYEPLSLDEWKRTISGDIG